MKVQVFYPFFPLPRTEAAHHLVIEQMEAIASLGHQVELVYWLGRQGTAPSGSSWGTCYLGDGRGNRESTFAKGFRVVSALARGYATTEEFHYPRFLLHKIAAIRGVDLQIFHYSFFWKILKDLPSGDMTRAVYFQNLESDLFALRASGESNPLFRWVHRVSSERLRTHELALASLPAELWFITPQDQREFLRRLEGSNRRQNQKWSPKVRMIPPAFDPSTQINRNRFFERWMETHTGVSGGAARLPIRLGFIGGLNFEPNRKGLEWILCKLVPQLEAAGFRGEISHVGRGDVVFERMAGKYLLDDSNHPRVRFEGFVENLDDWWASLSFSLIPDLTGMGVRIKLLESVASGIPVLTTQMGIERCAPEVGGSPLVFTSDDPAAWAQQIVRHQAFELRKKHLLSPFNQGLDGRQIYRFLDALEASR